MKRLIVALALSLVPPLAGSALAQSVNTLPPMSAIAFPPGSSTSTVTGQVAPGARALYNVQAKAGQTFMVSISQAPGTVTFQVFKPNATVATAASGVPLVTGPTLPGAGPSDNARAWIGAIPQDGSYLIVVGGAGAAPASYSLTVSLQ